MYTEYELEKWGSLFCRHQIYYRLRMNFDRFMGLSDHLKRECIRALSPTYLNSTGAN